MFTVGFPKDIIPLILSSLSYNEYSDALIQNLFSTNQVKIWRQASEINGGTVNGVYHTLDDQPYMDFWRRKVWFENGKYHRMKGPAIVGAQRKEWHVHGKFHRLDGPAIIDKGYQAWYVNGERHRSHGPAIINENENYE